MEDTAICNCELCQYHRTERTVVEARPAETAPTTLDEMIALIEKDLMRRYGDH